MSGSISHFLFYFVGVCVHVRVSVCSSQRRHTSRWLGRLWRNWTGVWTSWRPFRLTAQSARWLPTRCTPVHTQTCSLVLPLSFYVNVNTQYGAKLLHEQLCISWFTRRLHHFMRTDYLVAAASLSV